MGALLSEAAGASAAGRAEAGPLAAEAVLGCPGAPARVSSRLEEAFTSGASCHTGLPHVGQSDVSSGPLPA